MNKDPVLQHRCLIVEDQALIAISIEAYLEEIGLEAEPVSSCERARTWLETNTPKIVILDFLLKDGPATELATELKKWGIPFFIYSGFPWQLGIPPELSDVLWLEKPANRDEFLSTVMALAQSEIPAVPHS